MYKGRGNSSQKTSYRPIRLCSCLGKLIENVMLVPFMGFLKRENKFYDRQHRFARCRSIVTNVPTWEKIIADAILTGYHNDISFDAKAAFDKTLHRFVIKAHCRRNHSNVAALVCLLSNKLDTAIAGRKQFICCGPCSHCCYTRFSSRAQVL